MNTAPDPAAIDDPRNWQGGFYGIDIDLGRRDDTRLETALVNLWRAAGATGPFAEGRGGTYGEVDLSLASLHEHAHLRGVVQAPTFGSVVAGMAAIHFDSGDDLLALHLPIAALYRADARLGGYPFGGFAKPVWRVPLDAWLASIGAQVFAAVRFRGATIGMESGGLDSEMDGHLVPGGDSIAYSPGRLEAGSRHCRTLSGQRSRELHVPRGDQATQ
jgi:hypothetical protein